jgi:hypothetical protein
MTAESPSWPDTIDDSDKPFPVALHPASWFVTCTSCLHENNINHVTEIHPGHFAPVDGDQFIRCEECNAFIAVMPVEISEVPS